MRRFPDESGFTMVELIVASVVLGIAATAVATVFVTVIRLNQKSKDVVVATQAVQTEIEQLRNAAYANLTDGTQSFSLPSSLPGPTTATYTVSDADPYDQGNLKKVDIAVTFTEGSVTKKIQTSTLIATHGIDR